jgi:hypothetical protein
MRALAKLVRFPIVGPKARAAATEPSRKKGAEKETTETVVAARV